MTDACDRDGLKQRALALRGTKSIALIASDLGVTRNVVAGLFFRADHPGERTTGSGRGKVKGVHPKQSLRIGGKPGRRFTQQARRALGAIIELCQRSDAVHLRQEVLAIATRAARHTDARREARQARTEQARAL